MQGASESFHFVDDATAAREALAALAPETIVGLDTETFFDHRTKTGRVSLIQIAPRAGSILVIDALSVEAEIYRPLIESPEVTLVAHNARFDEAMLLGAGLRPNGFLDTLRMAQLALVLPSYSLAAVCEHLFGIPLDKSLRTSNWQRRPLTRNQLAYAAIDARMTLRVHDELYRRLSEEGRLEMALRASMLTPASGEKKARRKSRTPPPLETPLTAAEKRSVAHLKSWRLRRANEQRVPAYMICNDRTLEHLARIKPSTLEALKEIYGMGEAKIERYGEELLEALAEAENL